MVGAGGLSLGIHWCCRRRTPTYPIWVIFATALSIIVNDKSRRFFFPAEGELFPRAGLCLPKVGLTSEVARVVIETQDFPFLMLDGTLSFVLYRVPSRFECSKVDSVELYSL